jgi:hypothetical protein
MKTNHVWKIYHVNNTFLEKITKKQDTFGKFTILWKCVHGNKYACLFPCIHRDIDVGCWAIQ